MDYFFLGNGFIQVAVQIAPSGEGTPVGLIFMHPEHLRKKRESLSFDQKKGLDKTMLRIKLGQIFYTAESGELKAEWCKKKGIPSVKINWISEGFKVQEDVFCPNLKEPLVIREIQVQNIAKKPADIRIQTGIRDNLINSKIKVFPGKSEKMIICYSLDKAGSKIDLKFISGFKVTAEAKKYWDRGAKASFSSELLDHYFNLSCFQLSAVISSSAVVDASIWQYNREWVRDHSMIAIGLTLSGQHHTARKMLERLLKDFVSDEGDSIDSSERRLTDEVELDQNGELLYALEQYVLWSGDKKIIKKHWQKIELLAEFPLKNIFRHEPSGLIYNSREYWERDRLYGIEPGIEFAYQMYVSLGLKSAAGLARLISRYKKAESWEEESKRIRQAVLNNKQYGLVEKNCLIKRRTTTGKVQKYIIPNKEAQVAEAGPLSTPGKHKLEPDASLALPIAYGFIAPESSFAAPTLAELENLWNQTWEGGGYGRYHASSEPDSSGSWPFPSLFIARAYLEMGDFDKVWRVLRWLNTKAGAMSGSWFEFYGKPHSPPFAQAGITPWTWAEILILFITHILGIQPLYNSLKLRPRLLPGLEKIEASFPIRGKRLNLKIRKHCQKKTLRFHSNGKIIQQTNESALIEYPPLDMFVEVD